MIGLFSSSIKTQTIDLEIIIVSNLPMIDELWEKKILGMKIILIEI
jgi:hypothetical protein